MAHCDKTDCRYYVEWIAGNSTIVISPQEPGINCGCDSNMLCLHVDDSMTIFYRCVSCEHFKKLDGYIKKGEN